MTPILLTTTNEKQPDTVVAWDPLSGTPLMTFSGELAHRETLTAFNEGIVCAAAKKPFIQVWNFQSATTGYKRILTKSPVCAIVFTPDSEYMFLALERDIYVYQTSSGCLVAVLDGCHSVKVGQMKLSSFYHTNPTLLVTADISGFLAVWSLDTLMDSLNLMTPLGTGTKEAVGDSNHPDHKHSPLWYLIQASQGLPCVEFLQHNLLIAGSEGLKLLDATDGTLVSTALTSVTGGLHSVCSAPLTDGRIFCGGSDGLLHLTCLDESKCSLIADKEARRCFINSKLPSAQKTITALILSPGDQNLLIVGCRGGAVEVLRTDSLLTSLREFSVLNPIISGDLSSPHQLTGMCMVPRPDWLASSDVGCDSSKMEHSKNTQEDDSSTSSSKAFCGIEPLKHHFGWHLDDLVRIRIPAACERVDQSRHLADVYVDDFYELTGTTDERDEPDPGEVKRLKMEIDKLTGINRDLLRRLVDNELRS